MDSLITETVDIENYQQVYGNIGSSNAIGSILCFKEVEHSATVVYPEAKSNSGKLAIVGAGNFTKMTMLPAMDSQHSKGLFYTGNDSCYATDNSTLIV